MLLEPNLSSTAAIVVQESCSIGRAAGAQSFHYSCHVASGIVVQESTTLAIVMQESLPTYVRGFTMKT